MIIINDSQCKKLLTIEREILHILQIKGVIGHSVMIRLSHLYEEKLRLTRILLTSYAKDNE